MMPNVLLRMTLALLIPALTGCVAGRGNIAGEESSRVSSPVHTIVLARGQQAVIANESLTVELVEINDSRCPAEVACIWAGHAAVTLRVGKPGSAAGRVVIGTEAPSGMDLPADATYAGYVFHLLELEPGSAEGPVQATSSQRATIRVSRLEET